MGKYSAKYTKISSKIKEFLDNKKDKLSNKKALLHELELTSNYEEILKKEKDGDKIIEKINRTIEKLEIEFELSLMNDKNGGGKKTYADKFIKEENTNTTNIIINLSEDIREIK